MKESLKRPGNAILCRYLEVSVRSNESIEKAIKRFSRKVRKDGVMQIVMSKECFMRPSDIRREKRSRAKFNTSHEKDKDKSKKI